MIRHYAILSFVLLAIVPFLILDVYAQETQTLPTKLDDSNFAKVDITKISACTDSADNVQMYAPRTNETHVYSTWDTQNGADTPSYVIWTVDVFGQAADERLAVPVSTDPVSVSDFYWSCAGYLCKYKYDDSTLNSRDDTRYQATIARSNIDIDSDFKITSVYAVDSNDGEFCIWSGEISFDPGIPVTSKEGIGTTHKGNEMRTKPDSQNILREGQDRIKIKMNKTIDNINIEFEARFYDLDTITVVPSGSYFAYKLEDVANTFERHNLYTATALLSLTPYQVSESQRSSSPTGTKLDEQHSFTKAVLINFRDYNRDDTPLTPFWFDPSVPNTIRYVVPCTSENFDQVSGKFYNDVTECHVDIQKPKFAGANSTTGGNNIRHSSNTLHIYTSHTGMFGLTDSLIRDNTTDFVAIYDTPDNDTITVTNNYFDTHGERNGTNIYTNSTTILVTSDSGSNAFPDSEYIVLPNTVGNEIAEDGRSLYVNGSTLSDETGDYFYLETRSVSDSNTPGSPISNTIDQAMLIKLGPTSSNIVRLGQLLDLDKCSHDIFTNANYSFKGINTMCYMHDGKHTYIWTRILDQIRFDISDKSIPDRIYDTNDLVVLPVCQNKKHFTGEIDGIVINATKGTDSIKFNISSTTSLTDAKLNLELRNIADYSFIKLIELDISSSGQSQYTAELTSNDYSDLKTNAYIISYISKTTTMLPAFQFYTLHNTTNPMLYFDDSPTLGPYTMPSSTGITSANLAEYSDDGAYAFRHSDQNSKIIDADLVRTSKNEAQRNKLPNEPAITFADNIRCKVSSAFNNYDNLSVQLHGTVDQGGDSPEYIALLRKLYLPAV